MVSPIPRQSLALRVAEALRAALGRGEWSGKLPSERELAAQLRVGRNTVRAAMGILDGEGRIRRSAGRAHRVLAARRAAGGGEPRLHLVHHHRDSEPGLLHLLLGHFRRRGVAVASRYVPRSRWQRPEETFRALLRAHPRDAWILAEPTPELARWFENNARRVLAIGGGVEEALPGVSVDLRGMVSHAVGVLVGRGCRRVLLLECRRGALLSRWFREAFARLAPAHPGAAGLVAFHDATPRGFERALTRVFGGEASPDAVVLCSSSDLLPLWGFLLRRRIAVPAELSVLALSWWPGLGFALPSLARYEVDPRAYSRAILRMVERFVAGEDLRGARARVVPSFVDGGSVRGPGRSANVTSGSGLPSLAARRRNVPA